MGSLQKLREKRQRRAPSVRTEGALRWRFSLSFCSDPMGVRGLFLRKARRWQLHGSRWR